MELKKDTAIGKWAYAILVLILSGVLFALDRNIWREYVQFGFNNGVIGGLVMLLIVFLVFILPFVRYVFRKYDYSVSRVEGKVNFVIVEKRVNNSRSPRLTRVERQYEMRVGDQNYEDVDEDLLNIINEGDIYAFYHTTVGIMPKILSCEFIAKGK